MRQATTYKCTDHVSELEHTMRDFCSSCAPYWNVVPTCPDGHGKLKMTPRNWESKKPYVPKAYCRECKKHYALDDYSKTR